MAESSSTTSEEIPYLANCPIPFDLFVSKKYKGLRLTGCIRFTNSTGNLVYTVQKLSRKPASDDDPHCVKLLLDSSGKPLFSISRVTKRSWQAFKGNMKDNDLIISVNKTVDEYTRTEFKILLTDESKAELLHMKGSPFNRACTIYKDDYIVAETSLMYKLGIGKVFVRRSRFRVTFFPGFDDPILVACLVVIYFDGIKLWI